MKTENTQTSVPPQVIEEPLVEPSRQLTQDELHNRNVILAGRARYLGQTTMQDRARHQTAAAIRLNAGARLDERGYSIRHKTS